MKIRLDATTTKLLSLIIIVMWFVCWAASSFLSLSLSLSTGMAFALSGVAYIPLFSPLHSWKSLRGMTSVLVRKEASIDEHNMKNQIQVSLRLDYEFIRIDFPFGSSAFCIFPLSIFNVALFHFMFSQISFRDFLPFFEFTSLSLQCGKTNKCRDEILYLHSSMLAI